MATPPSRKRGGIQAVTKKLEASIQSGDYYHAQQMYKTLYFRYTAKKEYNTVCQLLVTGSCTMFKYNQVTEGSELAMLLLQHFKEAGAEANDASLGYVIKIFQAFPPEHSHLKRAFVKSSVSWTSKPTNGNQGAPELHNVFAVSYRSIKEYSIAEKHYLRGTDPAGYFSMLTEWALAKESSEVDLFVARGIFQYLCLANLKDANSLYTAFINQFPTQNDLTTFLKYFLITLQYDAYQLAVLLTQRYPTALQRDPIFNKALPVIFKVFYQVEPPTGLGGLMSSLFKSFAS